MPGEQPEAPFSLRIVADAAYVSSLLSTVTGSYKDAAAWRKVSSSSSKIWSTPGRAMPEESSSALDDNTFEFLGDSMVEASDDEAHTESIALTDGCTPDDA